MAVAYECPECKTAWPYYLTFDICPECRVVCRRTVTPRALSSEQARLRLLRIQFVRYYEAREAFRTGPSPEEMGRAEAREEIEQRLKERDEKDPGD